MLHTWILHAWNIQACYMRGTHETCIFHATENMVHVNSCHDTTHTHEYLPLVSDHSQVLSSRPDLLVNIYHLSVITHEYKSARQELLTSIFNSSVITREQCILRVAQAQHARYLQTFSRHKCFCKL